MSKQLYIGLMSGTSMDAIDCAIVEISNTNLNVIDFNTYEIPPTLKSQLIFLTQTASFHWQTLGDADIALAKTFAQAALASMQRTKLHAKEVTAIGSHGQTLWHQPQSTAQGNRFTWQLGDPSTIAHLTKITTIADFRRQDMAAGGQGAPLVPAFHLARFQSSTLNRVILNLGGIANITVIRPGNKPFGYDTGPANLLLDGWIHHHKQIAFDDNGNWATSGKVQPTLLNKLLLEPYFSIPHPKSTGRELFNLHWLHEKLSTELHLHRPEDIQATLLELTAVTAATEIAKHISAGEVLVCGGGARNSALMQRLTVLLPNLAIKRTSELGLHEDAVEAVAFAWFAHQTLQGQAIDFTPFTGASSPVIAGGIYQANASGS